MPCTMSDSLQSFLSITNSILILYKTALNRSGRTAVGVQDFDTNFICKWYSSHESN